jgi:putative effector of murein hydrolase
MSLVEAVTNVVVGYGVAVLTQLLVFPWFGLPARVSDALAIGAIFTAVSIGRSYVLRRLFETLRPVALLRQGRVPDHDEARSPSP